MNKICLLFAAACVVITSGCTSTKPVSSAETKVPSIITVGNRSIPTSEFLYVYNKNNANTPEAFSSKSINDYLELYTKFRLKVTEAEALGMDTVKSFKDELNGYKKQLAAPYLTEKSVTDNLIKEAYQRMLEEVKASHILIMVNPDADPKDTLVAYNKAMEIRKKALGGEAFDKLAIQYSQDPSAANNGGNLGYFSALQMIYPFEDAAYKTKPGEISMPIRTKFGYHIIKVVDKRKAKGELKVAHIMVRYSAMGNPSDSVAALKKANEIYERLKKGEKWDALCSEFSDDFNSRNKGGELPPFSTGNMIPSFEDGAFKLESIGDFGAPIQTPYGFHIIKLLEKKPIGTFESLESQIRNKVQKDSRSDLGRVYFINRLKSENKFTENTKAKEYAFSKADSTLPTAGFNFDGTKKENGQILFSIGSKNYLVKDFFAYIKAKQRSKPGIAPKTIMNNMYKDFIEESLIAFEEANLESKYNDYKMLVKEYRDGILLFSLMDQKVWSKAIEDTLGLKNYFKSNSNKYSWGKRCVATIYNCKSIDVVKFVKANMNNSVFVVESEKGGTINYSKGVYTISSNFKKTIDEVKNVLSRDKNYFVEITGSSDEKEPKIISQKRILEAKRYLISFGVDSSRITAIDKGMIKTDKKIKNQIDNKALSIKYMSKSITALEKSLNQKEPLSLQIKEGKFQKGDDVIIDGLDWTVGLKETEKNQRYYVVDVKQVLEPEPKTFEEARGQIISDYQAYLEKEWIESLRKKHTVFINNDEVAKIVKK
ncbi:MAG: peptidylprolyl isomerase [Bacteroidota bacterium]|nr:peptidylprolyl isomerase [Bacteroidota bacterium]